MKQLGFSIFIIFMLSGIIPFSLSIMQGTAVSLEVTTAIRNGDAQDVAKHFGANIDLQMPENEGTFSRNQAELILRNFFSRNIPESFTVSHQGSSRDGSVYVIGVYEATNGQRYRAYFLLKNVSNQMLLHQLQFEAQ